MKIINNIIIPSEDLHQTFHEINNIIQETHDRYLLSICVHTSRQHYPTQSYTILYNRISSHRITLFFGLFSEIYEQTVNNTIKVAVV